MDFSTEPEFDEKLRVVRGFVREEIMPIEPIAEGLQRPRADLAQPSAAGEGARPLGGAPPPSSAAKGSAR